MRSTPGQIRALRIAALALDAGAAASVVLLFGSIGGWVVSFFGSFGNPLVRTVWLLGWLALGALFLLRDAVPGGSPGKQIFGLRILGTAGAPPTVRQSIVRNLSLLIPFLIFYEDRLIRTDPEGRRIGDRWAGTRVEEK